MQTATIDIPAPVKLDPDASYDKHALAGTLGVSPRTIELWRKDRRQRFPRPYYQGRRPMWLGRVIVAWQQRRQEEAMT